MIRLRTGEEMHLLLQFDIDACRECKKEIAHCKCSLNVHYENPVIVLAKFFRDHKSIRQDVFNSDREILYIRIN